MRDQIIRIRATGDEVAKIRGFAISRGLTISQMMRCAALGVSMPARMLDHSHITLLTSTLGELGRIGGNLNQLVRRAHVGKFPGHETELVHTLDEINVLRDGLRELIK